MRYEIRDGKVQTFGIEHSLAWHCNLRCAGCSHASPFVPERFSAIETFERDLTRLATALHARVLRLLGGEPLLHPRIVEFLRIGKRVAIADRVRVTTNGLLLPSMKDDFWGNVDEVVVSLYPGARPPKRALERVAARAREAGVEFVLEEVPEFRTHLVAKPHPQDMLTQMIFNTCPFARHCHMLHEGTLFKCACPPMLPDLLTAAGIAGYDPKVDGLDIHAAGGDLRAAVESYLFPWKPLEACRHCLGNVGKRFPHHQLPRDLAGDPAVGATRRTHLDPRRLARESAGYFARRAMEMVAGRGWW